MIYSSDIDSIIGQRLSWQPTQTVNHVPSMILHHLS